jgi:hypothetical protein
MAATGFTPISTYYTTTASAVPTAGNLINGELALNINTADGKLFYKDSAGVVQVLATKASASGSFTNLAYTGTLTGGTGVVNLGSGQFYKDASGNVAIGTTTTVGKLTVVGGISLSGGAGVGNAFYPYYNSATSYNAIGSDANGGMTFITGITSPSIRATIDSSGNVLVGVTSNTGVDTGTQRLVVTGIAGGNGGTLGLISDSLGRNIVLTDSGKTQVATYSLSSTVATIGTNTSIPLVFNTVATERMRIDSSGNLLVGTTSNTGGKTCIQNNANNTNTLKLTNSASGDVGQASFTVVKYDNNNSSSQVFVRFLINNDATASGQINANGASQAAFGSWSDVRLKENIVDLPSQLNNIISLRPVEFDYKDGSGHQTGFVAQEIQAIYPDSVGTRDDGMLTVTGWNKTEAILVKAIQELNAEVQALKQQLGK